MKESYREVIASHSGPEPCECGGNDALEALDRGICRLGIELRNREYGMPTLSAQTEGNTAVRASASVSRSCGVEDPKSGRPRHRPQVVSGPGGEGDEP